MFSTAFKSEILCRHEISTLLLRFAFHLGGIHLMHMDHIRCICEILNSEGLCVRHSDGSVQLFFI